MGVYKRKLAKGMRWYFSGQFQGQKYFSKAAYLTKTECQKAEREKLIEIERNIDKPQNEMMLIELMNALLQKYSKQLNSKKYSNPGANSMLRV